MVNPIVLYVPPALPVLQTSSTAAAPYQPADDATSFTVSDAVDIQIISGSASSRPGAAGNRWPGSSTNGPGWWNDATPGQAASAYAAATRMSDDTPNGQLMDVSV